MQWGFLSESEALRLTRAYGARVDRVLTNAKNKQDLGRDFGCGFTEVEIDYLKNMSGLAVRKIFYGGEANLGCA